MMNAKLKNIISLLIVLLLTTTSIIKLEHHHKHIESSSKTESKGQQFHEKCFICNFEFSVYSLAEIVILSTSTEFKDTYNKQYSRFYHSIYSNYSFLLRTPPLSTNSIG